MIRDSLGLIVDQPWIIGLSAIRTLWREDITYHFTVSFSPFFQTEFLSGVTMVGTQTSRLALGANLDNGKA